MEVFILLFLIICLLCKIYIDNRKLKEFESSRNSIEAHNFILEEKIQELNTLIYKISYDIKKFSLLKEDKLILFELIIDKLIFVNKYPDIDKRIVFYNKLESCLYKLTRTVNEKDYKIFIETVLKEII